jgi:hypothetical protein
MQTDHAANQIELASVVGLDRAAQGPADVLGWRSWMILVRI